MNTAIHSKRKSIKNTFCVFTEVDQELIANKNPDYKSNSGSTYFYTNDGVFRLSNHWGRAANSKWRLVGNKNSTAKTRLGFAYWDAFHPDNETEKLYFIEVDYKTQTVNYNHKNNLSKQNKAVLRTSEATAKTIKQIRQLFTDYKWTKYYNIENIQQIVIDQLLFSEKSLSHIKKSLL